MINVVHGDYKIRVCQWTGESIMKRFRVPTIDMKKWQGCFGSPGASIAAITEMTEKNKLSPETHQELLDKFESSLRRCPGFEQEKHTITMAPAYTLLAVFGGTLSLDQFHQKYDHDKQVAMYFQEAGEAETVAATVAASKDPKDEIMEPSGDEEDVQEGNAPKKWHLTAYGPDVLPAKDEKSYTIPRGTPAFLDFLRASAASHDPQYTSSVVLYMHPQHNTVFGLGDPKDLTVKDAPNNTAASDVLGKTKVYGPVALFHKNELRERVIKLKKTDADKPKKATKPRAKKDKAEKVKEAVEAALEKSEKDASTQAAPIA